MGQSGQSRVPLRRDSSAEEANFRASLCEIPNSNSTTGNLQMGRPTEYPEVQVIDYRNANATNGSKCGVPGVVARSSKITPVSRNISSFKQLN